MEGGPEMGEIERLTNNTGGGAVFVYVQDGRIIRITPMEFDDTDAPSLVQMALMILVWPSPKGRASIFLSVKLNCSSLLLKLG